MKLKNKKLNIAYLKLEELSKLFAEARSDRDEAAKTWKVSGDIEQERIRARKYSLCELLSDFEKYFLHAKLNYDQGKDWKIPLRESWNRLSKLREIENGIYSIPFHSKDEKWMFFWPNLYEKLLMSTPHTGNVFFSVRYMYDLNNKEKEQKLFEKLPIFIDKFERDIKEPSLNDTVSALEYICRINGIYTQTLRDGLNKVNFKFNYPIGHALFTVETHAKEENLITIIDHHYFKNPNPLQINSLSSTVSEMSLEKLKFNNEQIERIIRKLNAYVNIKHDRKIISQKIDSNKSKYDAQIDSFVLNTTKLYLTHSLLNMANDYFDKKYYLKIRDIRDGDSQTENIIFLSGNVK